MNKCPRCRVEAELDYYIESEILCFPACANCAKEGMDIAAAYPDSPFTLRIELIQ